MTMFQHEQIPELGCRILVEVPLRDEDVLDGLADHLHVDGFQVEDDNATLQQLP